MDASEIINPKKTLMRREAEAMAGPAAAPAATSSTSKFTRAFTPEERKRQADKLAEMLRSRR